MYIPLTFEGALQSCLYASGGYEQGFFISGSQQYAFHLFNQTGSHQLQVLAGTLNNVSVALAGGGGGGASNDNAAGGGGGGGVIFQNNVILYAGTYNINIGRGGSGGLYQPTQSNPGETGSPSSFGGININWSVDGGKGGNGNQGGDSGAPTAYSGSAGTGLRGGAGGGAAGNATPATTSPAAAGIGGPGITASFGGETSGYPYPGPYGNSKVFGSGANGSGATIDDPYSQFGRGGIGVVRSTGLNAQDGRNGVVIVQYPINDYCKNWFNKTGSCGCSEQTFRIEEVAGGFYADLTGSFVYTQCGTNTLMSGSLISYFPVTVCAASNSYWWQLNSNTDGTQIGRSGFASGDNCFSASYGIQTCVTQSFTPTCTSSVWTFYAGTGSTTPQTLYYVPKNETNITYTTIPNDSVTYKCISSGSLMSGSIAFYPAGISGVGSRVYATASCRTTTFTTTGGGTKTLKYYNCGGSYTQITIPAGAQSITACIDMSRSSSITGVGSTTTYGGNCLSGSIDTGSCGCP